MTNTTTHPALAKGTLLPMRLLENISAQNPDAQVAVLEMCGFSCEGTEDAAKLIYAMMETWEHNTDALPDDEAARIQLAAASETMGAAIPKGMVDRWLRPDGSPTAFWSDTRLGKRVRSAWTENGMGDKVLEQVNQVLGLTHSAGGDGVRRVENADDALILLQQAQAFYRAAKTTRAAAKSPTKAVAPQVKDKLPPTSTPSVSVNNAPPESISHNGKQWAIKTRAVIVDDRLSVIINGHEISVTAPPCVWQTGNTGHRFSVIGKEWRITGQTAVAGYRSGKPSQVGVHMISLWIKPNEV